MGGLLVSYHLRGGLNSVPSTKGGMAGGCEGSVMESCTGETLGALLRVDGDGVLAPLILAMVEAKKLERGWAEARGGYASNRGPLEFPWRWRSELVQFRT